jgi:hypothetical protein
MSVLKLLNTRTRLVEEKLHVVMVISNPCMYRRRYELAREFMERMNKTFGAILYVVELAYGDQVHAVTQPHNPRHLQLRTNTPMWHKENMINLAVKNLLPSNWKAFAWIDADIEFKNSNWVTQTLSALTKADVLQPFSHAVFLDKDNNPTSHKTRSSCYCLLHNEKDWGNCGYAWAITRTAYERIGGLYPFAILGGGDSIMSLAFTKQGRVPALKGFTDSIKDVMEKARSMRVGYVPGIIQHYFHGHLRNRKYMERWQTLEKHNFDPRVHITADASGVLVPTPECPPQLLVDIMTYFQERNEDDATDECPPADPQSVAPESKSASP